MEVVICSDAAEVARLGAAKVAKVLRDCGSEAVIGVATGSSPVALYAELAGLVEAGELDLSLASAFALDEYIGLPPGHPESYADVIRRTVTEPLRMDPARVHSPDGTASDIAAACAAYEQAIKDVGGVDVQILGVGVNGHIGFNEPTSALMSRTRIKSLTPQTRADNARFFDSIDDVPVHCLTQGLGTIMDAREVVLIAQGEAKADAIAAMIEGPMTAMVPGSVLQLHPLATVLVDEAAASKLTMSEYYRWTFDHKPAWQKYRDGL